MRKTKFFAALCCTAMLFAACEKSEPTNNNSSKDQTIFTGTENGYEWVDLGLSVKWATMNVGANAPQDYGNYYAWGEITTKNTYDWSTYKYANGSSDAFTKYCSDASYGKDGFTDKLTTLTAADDAATQNWSGKWRMPKHDEWVELYNRCSWTWTDNYNSTDVAGIIVTSYYNGNSIFLPAAGYRSGDELIKAGSEGNYWLSSLSRTYCASIILFETDRHYADSFRCEGLSIRPVCK